MQMIAMRFTAARSGAIVGANTNASSIGQGRRPTSPVVLVAVTSTRTMAANADLAIPEASMAAFESCLSMLLERGMDESRATKAVKQAFGYGSQLYWRQEKVEAVVEVEIVERAIEYLEGTLGLSADGVVEVAGKFPEALTIDQSLMEENVGKLTDRFKMKGAVLANSIKRKPKVLGATTDCAGDCAGDWYVLVGTPTDVRPDSLTLATRFARSSARVALPSSN